MYTLGGLPTKSLNRRTVAVIHKHVIKRSSKRAIFRQFFQEKDDKKLVAAWNSDFDEIRRAFEVRPLTSTGRWLNSPLSIQTELVADTDISAPEDYQDVPNIHATVSGVGNEPMNPRTATSDVDRNVLESREDADDQDQAVRNTYTLHVVE